MSSSRKAQSLLKKRFPLAQFDDGTSDARRSCAATQNEPVYDCSIVAPEGHHWESHGVHCLVNNCLKSQATKENFWNGVLDDIDNLVLGECAQGVDCGSLYDGVCEYWEEDEA